MVIELRFVVLFNIFFKIFFNFFEWLILVMRLWSLLWVFIRLCNGLIWFMIVVGLKLLIFLKLRLILNLVLLLVKVLLIFNLRDGFIFFKILLKFFLLIWIKWWFFKGFNIFLLWFEKLFIILIIKGSFFFIIVFLVLIL